MWRKEGTKALTPGDILPWAKELEEKELESQPKASRIEPHAPPTGTSFVASTVETFARGTRKDLKELSKEEQKELAVNAINNAVESQMFGRVPKGWEIPIDSKPIRLSDVEKGEQDDVAPQDDQDSLS